MLEPGTTVGKYVVEALVGEGGLARVYRVRHITLGSAHALKLLAVRGGAVKRRLVREGQIQATLRHPHIVSVTDVIDLDGQPGLVMEYIEGLSMDRLLGARGALPMSVTLPLTAQILGAIGAAHSRSVLHRDLKPANVMLQPVSGGARAVVTDFGIARLMVDNGGDTLQGDFLGTPGFMAPEQVSDPTAVDRRADIYSLGALVYCMVCGRPPFLPSASMVDTLQAAQEARFPSVLSLRPDCPPTVAQAIEAALAPDPADRPDSVEAFGSALFSDDPDLMRVVGGHAGVVDLTLPGVGHNVAATPISQAIVAGTAVPSPSTAPAGSTAPPSAATVPSRSAAPAPPAPSGPSTPRSAAHHTPMTAVPEHFDLEPEAQPVDLAAGTTPTPQPPPPPDTTPVVAPVAPRWPWVAAAVLLVGGLGTWTMWPAPPSTDVAVIAVPSKPAATVAVPVETTPAPPTGAPPSDAPSSDASATDEPGADTPPTPPDAAPDAPAEPTPPEPPTGTAAAPDAARPADARAPADAAASAARSTPEAPGGSSDPAPEAPGSTPEDASGSAEAPPAEDSESPAPDAAGPALPTEDGTARPEDPVPEDAPPAEDAPPPEPEPMPDVTGTWKGKYGGRPLNLRITGQSGSRLTAQFDVLAGPQTWKTVELSGSVDAKGNVSLTDPGTGWALAGFTSGNALTGSIQHPDLRKPMDVRATRR